MKFDQSKRVRFAAIVYVEGESPEQAGQLSGIDGEGHRAQFETAAIERGDALLLYKYEVVNESNDDELDEDIAFTTPMSAYAVADETDPHDGFAYDIDFEAKQVYIDRDGVVERLSLGEFKDRAWRCDENGTLLVGFAYHRPEAQYAVCREHGLVSHMEELDVLFDLMKQDGNERNQMRGFWHDLKKLPETGETFEQIYERVYLENRMPLHERFSLGERTYSDWARVIDNPTFQNPTVRKAMASFLKERIGDFPVEEMAFAGFSSLEQADAVLSQAFPNRRVCVAFEGGDMMPGYKTSDVIEFDADGLTVIAFTDMSGMGYAYAYPTRRGLNLLSAPSETAAPKI